MPEYFYRYRSGHDKDLDALKRGYEWLSYPDDYNDPFDARIFVDKDSVITPALNKHFNEKADPQLRAMLKLLTGKDKLNIYGARADRKMLSKARERFGLQFSALEETCNEFTSQCEALVNEFEDSLDKNIKGLALICSFTKEKTNYLMWAHYSNSHKGYCLEYDFPGPLIEDGFIFPVSYRHSPVDVTNLVRKSGAGVTKILGRAAMGSALVKSHV